MKNNVKFLRRSGEEYVTQKQLAQAVGVSVLTIQQIENGANTSVDTALKIANYFNKDPREIFFSDDGAHVHRQKQTS